MFWTATILGVALLGHAVLCIQAANRLHAVGWPRWIVRVLTKLDHLWLFGAPAIFVWMLWNGDWQTETWERAGQLPSWANVYLLLSAAIAVAWAPTWLWRRLTWREPAALLSSDTHLIDLRPRLGDDAIQGLSAKLYAALPRNELLHLEVAEKTLQLARWPAELDGLSIAHLSDLHFTGGVGRAYFEAVVDATNDLQADVVALTGDVIDKARCLPWIQGVLSRLQAPMGKFFVLGNHDRRVNVPSLRKELAAAGFQDVSGRWQSVSWRGHELTLAGDERPWFGPAPDMAHCPSHDGGPPRILLAHTPDAIVWARRHDFDLLLAGHTHGGQIRFPVTGALLAPSRYGVRYASGTFFEPPTIMHVSRGVSGLQPLRFNCLPEVAKLVLRSPNGS